MTAITLPKEIEEFKPKGSDRTIGDILQDSGWYIETELKGKDDTNNKVPQAVAQIATEILESNIIDFDPLDGTPLEEFDYGSIRINDFQLDKAVWNEPGQSVVLHFDIIQFLVTDLQSDCMALHDGRGQVTVEVENWSKGVIL